MYRTIFGTLLFFLVSGTTWGEVTLHEKARPFPSAYNGPFVHTAEGSVLGMGNAHAHVSSDKGRTWQLYPALDPTRFLIGDYSVVVTKEGVIVCAFCNNKEKISGKWGQGSTSEWQIPVYTIRSTDGGKTWSVPLPVQRDWVGALRAMVVLESGRIVLATMAIAPEWHHIIVVYYSDDQGKSWTKTQTVDIEGSIVNDHDGAMEPKLVQLRDGKVGMLIRTTKGTFYQSFSADEGLTWSKPESTGIENNNSFGELARLSDGRLVLIWNRDDQFPAFHYVPDPKDWIIEEQSWNWIRRRNKLSIAFSSDDGKTWTDPIVIASTPNEKVWLAYAVFFEVEPGVFWITTQQGNIRMEIDAADLR